MANQALIARLKQLLADSTSTDTTLSNFGGATLNKSRPGVLKWYVNGDEAPAVTITDNTDFDALLTKYPQLATATAPSSNGIAALTAEPEQTFSTRSSRPEPAGTTYSTKPQAVAPAASGIQSVYNSFFDTAPVGTRIPWAEGTIFNMGGDKAYYSGPDGYRVLTKGEDVTKIAAENPYIRQQWEKEFGAPIGAVAPTYSPPPAPVDMADRPVPAAPTAPTGGSGGVAQETAKNPLAAPAGPPAWMDEAMAFAAQNPNGTYSKDGMFYQPIYGNQAGSGENYDRGQITEWNVYGTDKNNPGDTYQRFDTSGAQTGTGQFQEVANLPSWEDIQPLLPAIMAVAGPQVFSMLPQGVQDAVTAIKGTVSQGVQNLLPDWLKPVANATSSGGIESLGGAGVNPYDIVPELNPVIDSLPSFDPTTNPWGIDDLITPPIDTPPMNPWGVDDLITPPAETPLTDKKPFIPGVDSQQANVDMGLGPVTDVPLSPAVPTTGPTAPPGGPGAPPITNPTVTPNPTGTPTPTGTPGLDKIVSGALTPTGIASILGALGASGLLGGGGGGGSGYGSYGGGIPLLAASREQYEVDPSRRPGSAPQRYFGDVKYMAEGGITSLGSYSDGGRLLRGPGDGVSDDIPATIDGGQPAALASGEFVVPARVVSELGNGSTEAGARKLYQMMDRVAKARRSTKDIAADTKADRYLPA